MKIIKRKKILVKTERRLIVGTNKNDESIFCERCAEKMIHAQTAANLFDIGSREIYRRIETEKIHFFETDTKQIYVCPLSIKENDSEFSYTENNQEKIT